MWFYLVNIVIVATAITLELHPNKYLENLLLLGKVWLTFLACAFFLLSVCLAAKIRTKTNTNIAKNLITPKKGWRRILVWTNHSVAVVSVPIFVGLGQWWLAIAVTSIIMDVVVMKIAAREYMSMVTFDPKTKAVVIDVVPE